MREINHLSIHQWLRSAIPDSPQPTPPIRFPIFETSATALCGTTGTKNYLRCLLLGGTFSIRGKGLVLLAVECDTDNQYEKHNVVLHRL